MTRRVLKIVKLVRRVAVFLQETAERGKQIEQERAAERARLAARQRRRKHLIRVFRRTARRRRLSSLLRGRSWASIVCFVVLIAWRIVCFLLWVQLNHDFSGHVTDGAVVGWSALTALIYGAGVLFGIVGRALVSGFLVPLVSALIEYRRWKKAHAAA